MIRMLDAEGYPHAYAELDNFKIEFTEVKKDNGKISAKATFIQLNKGFGMIQLGKYSVGLHSPGHLSLRKCLETIISLWIGR